MASTHAAFGFAMMLVAMANASPVVVFDGGVAVADSIDGLDLGIAGGPEFELNFAYFGTSVNSIFGWDGVVRDAGDGAMSRTMNELDGNGSVVLIQLFEGDVVGPGTFTSAFEVPAAAAYEDYFNGLDGGAWLDQEPRYFGFSFELAGDTHYGYGLVQIDNAADPGAGNLILIRVAYESDADTDITVASACVADCDGSGTLNLDDIDCFVAGFLGADLDTADCDGNGTLNLDDIDCFVSSFLAGCL